MTDWQEFLDRRGIDINDIKTIRDLQNIVRGLLRGHLNSSQMNTLASYFRENATFANVGIKSRLIPYATGAQTRYFIPGLPGLFNYNSAQQFLQSAIEE